MKGNSQKPSPCGMAALCMSQASLWHMFQFSSLSVAAATSATNATSVTSTTSATCATSWKISRWQPNTHVGRVIQYPPVTAIHRSLPAQLRLPEASGRTGLNGFDGLDGGGHGHSPIQHTEQNRETLAYLDLEAGSSARAGARAGAGAGGRSRVAGERLAICTVVWDQLGHSGRLGSAWNLETSEEAEVGGGRKKRDRATYINLSPRRCRRCCCCCCRRRRISWRGRDLGKSQRTSSTGPR